MKKLNKIFACILCCFSLFLLVGCDSHALTMSRYFNSTVESGYNSSSKKYNLSSFVANKPDTDTMRAHTYLKFTGVSNWIYDMNIEYVTFYFYCSKTVEVNQLQFKMTGLDGGESNLTLSSKYVSKILAFNATKEKGLQLRVDIGHRATMDELAINLEMQDENIRNNDDFEWTIYGLQVYGDM